jgi:hypothetical protein
MRKPTFVFSVIGAVAIACGGSSSSGIGSSGGAGDDGGGGGSGTGEASNPPGCPSSAPAAGGSCTLADGTHCNYGCFDGHKTFATCTTSKWDVSFSGANACTPPDPPPGTPFACGSATCGATQYCIHPCCGGVAMCIEKPEGGTCPAGTTPGQCSPSGQEGCIGGNCTPPPPYCVDDPKTVQNCGPGVTSGKRDISCVCA